MGSSMCGHLIAAGYPAVVYNRTPEKAKALVDRGARLAGSPAEVAGASDVVFTIVGYPADVREVTLGRDGTPGRGEAGCGRWSTMTTSEPALAREIFEAARRPRGRRGRRPGISGGDVGARKEARLPR